MLTSLLNFRGHPDQPDPLVRRAREGPKEIWVLSAAQENLEHRDRREAVESQEGQEPLGRPVHRYVHGTAS